MRIIYIVFAACLCIACGNNPKRDKVERESKAVASKPILDSILIAGIIELVEDENRLNEMELKSRSAPLSESCLVMIFEVNPEMSQIFFSDTTIYISFKVGCQHPPLDTYKGILSIANHNLAIFDKHGIGNRYYNSDSLKMIPFDKFKNYALNFIPALQYYIKNSELHYWNP